MFVVKVPGNREMNAVGGRTRDVVHARLCFEYTQRHVEGEGVARATAIAVWSYDSHGHVCKGGKCLPQAADALRAEAVVVTN
jgi:hypothetical protein